MRFTINPSKSSPNAWVIEYRNKYGALMHTEPFRGTHDAAVERGKAMSKHLDIPATTFDTEGSEVQA